MRPRVLILHANGSNRDLELAHAFELAGAEADIKHLNQLRDEAISWQPYQILAIPGGFSYADTLSAGKLFALELEHYFSDAIHQFVESGKPVLGVCNGFQVLTKLGLLPNIHLQDDKKEAALTFNASGQFECRWVTLLPASQTCLWTRALNEPIYCPVAHGEGQLIVRDKTIHEKLQQQDQIALRYALPDQTAAKEIYPFNPNGSIDDIAGLCNPAGNVLGLMPHPEDHVLPYQHPRWTRGERGCLGLKLFANSVLYFS